MNIHFMYQSEKDI